MKKEIKEENNISAVVFQALSTLRSLSVHQSMTKVAHELGMSVSTVSSHMIRLEKEFNKKLYIRKGGGIQLTPDGEILLRTSVKFLETIESLKGRPFAEVESDIPQTFCVATSQGIGNFWLIDFMTAFVLENPSYLPSLFTHPSERDLFMQDPDLILWPKIKDRQDLRHEFLFTFEFGLYASADYIKVYGKPNTFAELESHRLIRYSLHNNNPFEAACNNLFNNISESKAFIEVNNNIAMGTFIQNGFGIGPLSYYHVLHKTENFIPLLPELVVSEDLYANYKKDLDPKHPAMKFLHFVKLALDKELKISNKLMLYT